MSESAKKASSPGVVFHGVGRLAARERVRKRERESLTDLTDWLLGDADEEKDDADADAGDQGCKG